MVYCLAALVIFYPLNNPLLFYSPTPSTIINEDTIDNPTSPRTRPSRSRRLLQRKTRTKVRQQRTNMERTATTAQKASVRTALRNRERHDSHEVAARLRVDVSDGSGAGSAAEGRAQQLHHWVVELHSCADRGWIAKKDAQVPPEGRCHPRRRNRTRSQLPNHPPLHQQKILRGNAGNRWRQWGTIQVPQEDPHDRRTHQRSVLYVRSLGQSHFQRTNCAAESSRLGTFEAICRISMGPTTSTLWQWCITPTTKSSGTPGWISVLWDGSECCREWMSTSWRYLKSEFRILMLLLGRRAVLEIPSPSYSAMSSSGIRPSTSQSLAWKPPKGHATWFSE